MEFNTVIFANTVAKYNEGKILSPENLRRIADTDYESAVKMLADYGYVSAEGSVDEFIAREISVLISYIANEVPSKYLARILLNPYYYSNVKAIVKNKYSPFDYQSVLYDVQGTTEFIEQINSGEPIENEFVSKALGEIFDIATTRAITPADIDLLLTRAQFADTLHATKKLNDSLIKKYVSAKIDLINFSVLLRSNRLKVSYDNFLSQLLDGGEIPLDRLSECFNKTDDEICEEFLDTQYYDVLCYAKKSMARFETAGDDYLFALCYDKSLDMSSLAPILTYVIKKQNELATVKTLLVCLKSNAKELLRDRLKGMEGL